MAHNQANDRHLRMRRFAVIAWLCLCGFSMVGTSALLLGTFSTAAFAGGGHHGHGGHHGGFHRGFGAGVGLGFWPYGYGYPYGYGGYLPYEGDLGVCYAVERRVKTRHGWGTRRVSICE
jgi:hypothetical protein